jgi:hypothetical protein
VRPARRLLLLVPAGVLLLSALLPVSFSTPIPLCAIKALTGVDCPGCGMTRAFLLIGHGRIAEAAGFHPLGVPAFLIVAGMALAGIVRAVTGAEGRSGSRTPLDPPLPMGGDALPPVRTGGRWDRPLRGRD